MWMRSEHAELDLPILWEFIRQNPLGMLITSLPFSEATLGSASSQSPEIQVTHIPWVLDVDAEPSTSTTTTSASKGRLRGHLARQNPQAKALLLAAGPPLPISPSSIQARNTSTVLEHPVSVIFNSPAHAYVPPHFYVATHQSTGKIAPTWNYSAVQVWGRLRIWTDAAAPDTNAYLQRQLEDLSRLAEEDIMGHVRRADRREGDQKVTAWEVADAPERFVKVLRKAIVGVEVEITSLEGKVKMSQELSDPADRRGVIEGFERMGGDGAREVARLVRTCGEKREAERRAAKAEMMGRRSQSRV